MIIECKAADHKLSERDSRQVSTYGASIKPGYLGLTNGLRHIFWKVNYELRSTEILSGFPSFEELMKSGNL